MRRFVTIGVFLLLSVYARAQFQGLVVNEFSQGNTGNREYIEIVVVGNRTCTDSTADIRGWIFDDQNGWYGNSNSTQGHYRFRDVLNWSKVPFGAIILLYNSADKNSSITLADDPTDINGDLAYIIPINSNAYLEQFAGGPDNNSGPGYSYPAATSTTGYVPTNNQWQFLIALNNNNGDVISLVSPSNRGSAFFSIAYGYHVAAGFQSPAVTIPNVGGGNNASLSTGNYLNASDWQVAGVPVNETPGLPNGGANTTWIEKLRLGRPRIASAAAATPICFSANQQQTTLAYSSTWNLPDQFNIVWDVMPINNFVPVTNTALTPGVIDLAIPASTPSGTYTGQLTVTNSNGVSCSSIPFSVTVNPLPAVSTGSYGPVCTNSSSFSLTGSPAGGVFSGSGVSGNNFTPPGIGNHSIQYTFTDPSTGCSNTAATTIVVNPQPAPPLFSLVQPTCTSSFGTIAIISPSGPGLSYSIDGVDYSNSSGVFSNLPAGHYFVTVRNSTGCVSLPAPVTINTQPITPIVTVSSPTICPGDVASITAAPLPMGLYNYTWTVPAGVANPGNVASFTSTTAGAYTVTITNVSGCSSSSSGTLSIHANASVTADSKEVCAGSQVQLSGQPAGGVWTGAGTNGSQFNSVALSPGQYTVTYTHTTGSCSGSATATILVKPVPLAPTLSVANNCNGTSDLTAVNFSGALLWSTGQTTPFINVVSSGAYSATQTLNGCTSAPAMIMANPFTTPPAPIISNVQQPDCTAPTGSITVSIPSASTFFYSIDGINYTNSAGHFTGLAPGSYPVSVRSVEGCTSLPTTVVINAAVSAPPAPVLQVKQPTCSIVTGSITVQLPMGVGLEYSLDGATYQPAANFNNLFPGNYAVWVRNSSGCVSPPTAFTIQPVSGSMNTSASMCIAEGTSFLFNGQLLTSTGNYSTTYVRPGLCDSVVHLYLLLSKTETQNVSACESFTHNGIIYTSSTILKDTVRSKVTNCDSLYRTTNIIISSTTVTEKKVCLPAGQTYHFNGMVLSSGGQYATVIPSSTGCDSTINLILTIAENVQQQLTDCKAVSYNGVIYTSNATVTEAIPAQLTGCDSIIRTTAIVIPPKPSITISRNQTICRGDSIALFANAGTNLIEWPGIGVGVEVKVSPSITTTYTAVAFGATGCTDTAKVTVTVTDFDVNVVVTPNPAIAGKAVQLHTSANASYQILTWQPVMRNQAARQHTIVADSTRWVKVLAQSSAGCIAADSVLLMVDPLGDVYIPTAFTPNSDGKNDLFIIGGGNFIQFNLIVFNRWGQTVFQSLERTIGWDGKLAGKDQPMGTYVYQLTATTKDGQPIRRKGTINLIR